MHRPSLLPPALGGLLLLVPTLAQACDSCGCHMPSDFTPEATGWSVGLFDQYTDFGTLRDEGRRTANPDQQWMHSSTTQLVVGYRFSEVLTVDAYLPYIVRYFRRPDSGFEQTGSVRGLGDSVVQAKVRLASAADMGQMWALSAIAGLKAPSGNPRELKYEYYETQGVTLPGDDIDPSNATGGHDLALGSGAWDAIGGLAASYRRGNWFVSGIATYTYNTEGAYTYRFANEIALEGSLGYFAYVRAPWRVCVQANLSGDSKGLDTVDDQKTTDTANHNLYIGPEITAMWSKRLVIGAALDVPLEEHNSATQLVPTWRSRASVTVMF